MQITDVHTKAVAEANKRTSDKYGDAEFRIGEPKHDFWLREYDKASQKFMRQFCRQSESKE